MSSRTKVGVLFSSKLLLTTHSKPNVIKIVIALVYSVTNLFIYSQDEQNEAH